MSVLTMHADVCYSLRDWNQVLTAYTRLSYKYSTDNCSLNPDSKLILLIGHSIWNFENWMFSMCFKCSLSEIYSLEQMVNKAHGFIQDWV